MLNKSAFYFTQYIHCRKLYMPCSSLYIYSKMRFYNASLDLRVVFIYVIFIKMSRVRYSFFQYEKLIKSLKSNKYSIYTNNLIHFKIDFDSYLILPLFFRPRNFKPHDD